MISGEEIRLLRKKNGFTQEKLADLLNVARTTVLAWEKNTYSPEGDNLINLAKALNVSVGFLLGEVSDSDIRLSNKEIDIESVESMDNVTKAIVILRSVVKDKRHLPASDRKLLREVMLHGAKALEDDPEAEEITSD